MAATAPTVINTSPVFSHKTQVEQHAQGDKEQRGKDIPQRCHFSQHLTGEP